MNHFDLFNKHYIFISSTAKTYTFRNIRKGTIDTQPTTKWISVLDEMFVLCEVGGDTCKKAVEVLESFKTVLEDGEDLALPFELDPQEVVDLKEITELHMPVRSFKDNTLLLIQKGVEVKAGLHIDAYKDQFSSSRWNEIKTQIPLRLLTYNVDGNMPEKGYVPTSTGERKAYKYCNTYLPPLWRSETTTADLHPDHKVMIESRFLDAESLERYYCALYHTMTSRNKTIVGLVHKRQGTGKSITMGAIPGVLVGMDNYSVTDRNFIQSSHKDILLEKRAILLDEAVIYKSDSTRVKQLTEHLLYVNPKGIKALNVDNHISWFLASNNESDIYVEPGDRRYCFLEDSGQKITDLMGAAWVTDYMNRIYTDTEFVANLGYYILNNFKKPKYSDDAIYRGPTFERVVRATAPANLGDIVDDLLQDEEEEISYFQSKKDFKKDLKTSNGRAPNYPSPTEFIDFFSNFRWSGKPICEVIQGDKRTDIILKPIK